VERHRLRFFFRMNQVDKFELEDIRRRIESMSDLGLIKFGRARVEACWRAAESRPLKLKEVFELQIARDEVEKRNKTRIHHSQDAVQSCNSV
jgi:hypothetical protein